MITTNENEDQTHRTTQVEPNQTQEVEAGVVKNILTNNIHYTKTIRKIKTTKDETIKRIALDRTTITMGPCRKEGQVDIMGRTVIIVVNLLSRSCK